MQNENKNRGSLTDRKGVNIVESTFLNDLQWLFREQTVSDYGIDAIVEQCVDDNPTGKLISVQIKTGLSYLKTNTNGDFIFYPTKTHVEYWLSSSIPVILVLCNPDTKVAYWIQIAKRNLETINKEKYKITISNSSILSVNSRTNLENIISAFSPNIIFNENIAEMSTEELSHYASELMSHCSDSLKLLRQSVENHGNDSKLWVSSLENLLSDVKLGMVDESRKNKRIKNIGRTFTTSLNVLRTRLGGTDLKIMIESHVKAFCLIDRVMDDFGEKVNLLPSVLAEELRNESVGIISLIDTVKKVAEKYKDPDNDWGQDFVQAMSSCSITLEDYAAELESLSDIIQKYVDKLKVVS